MALREGEALPAKGGLLVVLWLEIIVYFLVGFIVYYKADFGKPKPWVKNAFVEFQVGMGEKFHGSIALILGCLALQGIYSGLCSRFELEMMFFTLSLLMSMIWPSVGHPFGVKGVVLVIVTKPEFWFQLFMWCCYWTSPPPRLASFEFWIVWKCSKIYFDVFSPFQLIKGMLR